MRIGDVVIPMPGGHPLVCGSGRYTHAICCSVDPFILVSEEADMRWSVTIEPHYFVALCQAHPEIVARCLKRLERDRKSGLLPT